MTTLRAPCGRRRAAACRPARTRARWFVAGVVLSLALPAARAESLLEAWRAARDHDLEFAVARASARVGEARRAEAGTLWRPYVQFAGTAGVMSSDVSMTGAHFSAPGFGATSGVDFNTSVRGGNSIRLALSAKQPIFNREREAQARQLELSADSSDLEWKAAQQALMLRTAERYLDVALAQESVRVLERQQAAVERSLAEVEDRYRIGDAPITDTLEAKARARAIGAQLLAARTDLQVREAALADVVGTRLGGAQVLVPGDRKAEPPPGTLAQALAQAASGNLSLQMQRIGVAVARQEARKLEVTSAPTADLVAQVSRDHLGGSGDFGSSGLSTTTGLVGVQVTVPLYTGGNRGARHVEALRAADKATAQADLARQQVELQARTAWTGLSVGVERITALEQALRATRERLDATRLGHEVGDRTTLDLLNAQNDLSQAELALTQARAQQLLGRLRLAMLLGQLDEARLREVDSALAPASPQ